MPDKLPNPGSSEAQEQGCTCPVLDNAHGQGAWGSSGALFVIDGECPVHGTPKTSEQTSGD